MPPIFFGTRTQSSVVSLFIYFKIKAFSIFLIIKETKRGYGLACLDDSYCQSTQSLACINFTCGYALLILCF